MPYQFIMLNCVVRPSIGSHGWNWKSNEEEQSLLKILEFADRKGCLKRLVVPTSYKNNDSCNKISNAKLRCESYRMRNSNAYDRNWKICKITMSTKRVFQSAPAIGICSRKGDQQKFVDGLVPSKLPRSIIFQATSDAVPRENGQRPVLLSMEKA